MNPLIIVAEHLVESTRVRLKGGGMGGARRVSGSGERLGGR